MGDYVRQKKLNEASVGLGFFLSRGFSVGAGVGEFHLWVCDKCSDSVCFLSRVTAGQLKKIIFRRSRGGADGRWRSFSGGRKASLAAPSSAAAPAGQHPRLQPTGATSQ